MAAAEFDLLQRAKARMMFDHIFFSTLLLSTPLRYMTPEEEKRMRVMNDGVATAWTDMREIVVSREFIEGPEMGTVNRVMFVLAHELGHIILKHGLRRQGRERERWNVAGDHAINIMLLKDKFEIWGKCHCDVKEYEGKSTEQIYELLEDEEGGGGGTGKGPGGGLGWDIVDFTGETGDPAEASTLDYDISQRIAAAATIARQAGQMTSDLERLVGKALYPNQPWRQLLQRFMHRLMHRQETWAYRNRRYSHVYLPTRRNKVMGPVLCLGDTSGSVTNNEIGQVAKEFIFMRKLINPEYIEIVWGDTQPKSTQRFYPSDPIDLKPVGGGGTDMRTLLAYAEEQHPEVVVLITDGYTPWPEKAPPYPLIVVCTSDVHVPFGQVARYNP